ncbi:MAG: hypothetical protein M1818_008459 [Claussenomyces sp. TS43310]|nr:MAG: hypothetical protein M1818_008459 [Claussenomyces sp. TS43310]
MFDIFAKLLSSVATFLFPVFASYKALKTSDPALLTPWLMYWVVLACALLVESWTEFILVWIPFYPWIRAAFLLYLIAPQTQGAKVLYQEHVHPFLHEHEVAIEDFIASAHERAKTAGLSYLKQAIDLLKQHLLGLPPPQPTPPPPSSLSYTQALINRFNLPSARPATSIGNAATSTATDFYSLLASAVSAATASSAVNQFQQGSGTTRDNDLSNSGTLIPPTILGRDRMSFITAQRERLSILLTALDKEAIDIKTQEAGRSSGSSPLPGATLDGSGGEGELPRPASAMSAVSKGRSELDFEKIENDGEDDPARPEQDRTRSSSWLPWSWSAKTPEPVKAKGLDTDLAETGVDQGRSSGVET